MYRTALLALVLLAPLPAAATDVEVRVLNMADGAGSLRVNVCTAAEWLKDCALSGRGPARAGVASVTVPGVPPGLYGITAYHDSNDNGEVDQNFLGIPTEGVGFSRDAPARFSAPRFADAVLRIEGARVLVDITLHFEQARR